MAHTGHRSAVRHAACAAADAAGGHHLVAAPSARALRAADALGDSRLSGSAAGRAGAAGVVVIRYPTGTLSATGGTTSTSGIYTLHTFTTSGTFTVL